MLSASSPSAWRKGLGCSSIRWRDAPPVSGSSPRSTSPAASPTAIVAALVVTVWRLVVFKLAGEFVALIVARKFLILGALLDTGDKVLAHAMATQLIYAQRQQWRRGLISGEGKIKDARVWALSTQRTA
jgi:hypothetical protein